MTEDAELLWYVNNEHRARLAQASRSVELLIQLLRAGGDDGLEATLAALFAIDDALTQIAAEHRDWRYRSYYIAPEDRRMVQEPRAVRRALSGFGRMLTAHQHVLASLWTTMASLPRPDVSLTTVAVGDLWWVTQQALDDLIGFSNALQAAAS